jgi:hypothetical protein
VSYSVSYSPHTTRLAQGKRFVCRDPAYDEGQAEAIGGGRIA